MTYTEILVLICLCIFVVVLLYITVQLTKGINLQIRTCGKMAKWAKQELERKEERGMSDLISRQDAIDEVINLWAEKPFGNPALVEIKDCIEALPSAERKRGEWIETSSGDHWKCSRCNYRAGFWFDEENSCEWSMDVSEWLSNFCPNCGAEMKHD